MSGLRVRRLRLVAETTEGRFGTELSFEDGLNLIRADNSSGKSTVMQAIAYGLGIDAIIDLRHDVPLTAAMTDMLQTPSNAEIPVTESFVMIEVENESEERRTFQRYALHPSLDRHLVRMWNGGALSQPNLSFEPTDFYVRRPGAAQNPAGFHRMLAEFMGWDLPSVLRDDGSEVPLYIELVFPLLYVEQRRGWGGIQANTPSYGIPAARRRALEFLLDMGIYRRARARAELNNQLRRLQAEYVDELSRLSGLLEANGVVLQGLGSELPTAWPEVAPRLVTPRDTGGWDDVAATLDLQRKKLTDLKTRAIPDAEAAAKEVSEALERDETRLQEVAAGTSALRSELALDEEQEDSLRRRIAALSEDQRRYEDAVTLRKLGSEDPHVHNVGEECPTCHQRLPAALLVAEEPPPMSLDENLDFIREQRNTFRLMLAEIEHNLGVKRQRLRALRTRSNDLRQSIRAARDTLISPARSPSLAAVRDQLQLEDRVVALEDVLSEFSSFEEAAQRLIGEGRRLRDQLRDVPLATLDASDEAKLDALEHTLRDQLREYGFGSFDIETIGISRENYLPTREDLDLGFVTSASDLIRLVWAYLLGLLEVARSHPTNHPGILMFDEPGQQSIADLSFEALVQRASGAIEAGQQVIFATSQSKEALEGFLGDREYWATFFEGRVLAPMAD